MTIGPAPMIRIEEMSVRLGIQTRDLGHKKRARSCASPGVRALRLPGARALFRPFRPGREGDLWGALRLSEDRRFLRPLCDPPAHWAARLPAGARIRNRRR